MVIVIVACYEIGIGSRIKAWDIATVGNHVAAFIQEAYSQTGVGIVIAYHDYLECLGGRACAT